jgi:hypothetical protein
MYSPRLLATALSFIFFTSPASSTDRVLGPFSSEIGQLRFKVSDGTASSAGSLQAQVETDARRQLWSTIYSCQSDNVVYLLPLSPISESFLIVESLGSGYRTVILNLDSPHSVSTQLDASGKDFPEVIRAGAEATRFVIIPNASKVGDIIDVEDIYALLNGVYKFEGSAPYGEGLATVQRLSRKIDEAAADRRKGVVVRP